MIKQFMRSLVALLFFSSYVASALTPTENFLTQITEEEVAEIIKSDVLKIGQGFDFNQYADFFHSIIAEENEYFIGYHATTTDHFIFNEFVKIILEEHHNLITPNDFYFLRIPYLWTYDMI